MSKSYRIEKRKGTVGAMVGDAFSELQSLRDEMQEIVDNMEGANMGHMPKCEAAGEAVSELESADCDSEPDVPESLAEIEIEYSEQVQRRKGRAVSRAVRCDNAQSMLQAVRDALQERENDEDADELVQAIDAACDMSVEFPGMYG